MDLNLVEYLDYYLVAFHFAIPQFTPCEYLVGTPLNCVNLELPTV